MEWRKKPVVVEAVQFFVDQTPLPNGVQKHSFWTDPADIGGCTFIENHVVLTIHNHWTPIADGDWIITEPDGVHHYPCKPDIFEKTYERADESNSIEGEAVAELKRIIKELIPMAEDGHIRHVSNASHQEFLNEDLDLLRKAKKAIE